MLWWSQLLIFYNSDTVISAPRSKNSSKPSSLNYSTWGYAACISSGVYSTSVSFSDSDHTSLVLLLSWSAWRVVVDGCCTQSLVPQILKP